LKVTGLTLILSTRFNIRSAGIVAAIIAVIHKLVGQGDKIEVTRRGIKWALDLKEGIDFSIYLTGAFEPNTIAAYKAVLNDGDVAIDIGANIGAHTLHLAQAVGPSGHVYAVEPASEIFFKLIQNSEINPDISERISAFQVMLLADDNTDIPKEIYARWPLQKSAEAHPLHLGIPVSTSGAARKTLDEFVLDKGINRIDFIKLDVDGFELDVLKGAAKTLAKLKPTIIFEHSPYTSTERGIDANAIIDILKQGGYRFHNLAGRKFDLTGMGVPQIASGSSVNILAIHTDNIS
jgi:FkbM family methyltransferase